MDWFTTGFAEHGLAASVASGLSINDLYFILRGFLVVMILLTCLWLVTEVIGRYFAHQAARAAKPAEVQPRSTDAGAETAAVPTPVSELDPTHPDAPFVLAAATYYARRYRDPKLAAIIAAAAYEVVGAPVEIISIRGIDPRSGWAQEGRRQHFGSHKLR